MIFFASSEVYPLKIVSEVQQLSNFILQVMCDRISFEGNFEEIALRTPGYVAGDLKKLVEKSQGLAWKR